MKLKITLGLFLATFLLSAQSARMNRDIEVAEKILETLLEEAQGPTEVEENVFVIGGNNANVEGTYIEGFGAMFSITSGNSFRPLVWSKKKEKDKDKSNKSGSVTIIQNSKKKYHLDLEDMEANKEDIQKTFKSVVETFACDYGYLMRQLADDEQIMIRYGMNSSSVFNWATSFDDAADNFPSLITLKDRFKSQNNYTASIKKSDIDDFQSDRINDSQLKERIQFVFEEAEEQKEKYKDLDLLSTILSKLHKNDYGNPGLYLRSSSNYEKIDGLGAIYSLTVRTGGRNSYFGLKSHSSVKWGENGFFIIADDDKDDEKSKLKAAKEAEERLKATENSKIDLDKSYTAFIKDFKNNIVDYGSVVKSLKAGEALIFNLKFPKCEDCKTMPKSLKITAKKTTLDGYRKDQISLESAVNQLIVK